MATFEELMRAAARADAAGDSGAARQLVQAAKAIGQQADGPIVPPPLPADVQAGDMPSKATGPQRDNFGDTIAEVTEPSRAAFSAFGKGVLGTGPSPTMQAMPESWNPALRSVYAKGGDLAMAGLSGLGVGVSGAAGLLGETFGGSPTNERKLANDLMMMAEVSVPELAGVSSATLAAGKAANAATKAQAPATASQQAARAATDLGITPSLGMLGKNRAMIAAGMEKLPGSASVIARDAARAVGEVERAFQGIRGGIGNAMSPTSAGEALQEGLRSYEARFRKKAEELYSKVPVPQSARVNIDQTARAISDMKDAFAGNEELARRLGVTNWDSVIAEAQANGISWGALREFRSSVGRALGSVRGTLANDDVARLKQLYGTLTDDMSRAVETFGPQAKRAWESANSYYKNGESRIERSLDATISAKNPERAFEAFANITKADRATTDLQRMRQIKASLKPSEWNDISASIIDRLGKASSGAQNAAGDVFSPGKFLTEWNKLDPQAKRILLPQGPLDELNKLATVAERVKAAGAERNMSNTGTAAGWLSIVFGANVAPTTTATAIGSSYISAKALTSQPFLRAMNAMARGDSGQMRAMSRGGPFAQDAQTILRISGAQAATPANNETPPASKAVR